MIRSAHHRLALALLGCVVLAPGTAQAGDSELFGRCDGMGKPGKSADGLGSPVSVVGPGGFSATPSQAATIDACNVALDHPKLLPGQQVRRAHLLRARALARLNDGKLPEALADLDLADAAVTGPADDGLYRRSMRVSLNLLRALIYDRMGNADAVLRLVRDSIVERPYAWEVQRVAAHLLLLNGANQAGDLAALDLANRLDPSFADYQIVVLGMTGDFKTMARLASPVFAAVPKESDGATAQATLTAMLAERTRILGALQLSYARAATGDVAGARRDLAAVKEMLSGLARLKTTLTEQAQASLLKPFNELVAMHELRITARIALQEGRTADADKALSDARLPMDAATIDLFKHLNTALGRPMVTGIEQILAERQNRARIDLFNDMAGAALIEPETPGMNSVYKRSRPDVLGALVGAAFSFGTTLLEGVKNTDGYVATPGADGTFQISLTAASTSSTVVREAALLRAAELALAEKKAGFVIVDRNEYRRTWTTTQYGRTISSVPNGYKSDIKVRLLDTVESDPRAFDARALADALGPFFYRDKT